MSYIQNNLTISSGNILPNDWYQKFTNDRGSPDLSLMSVLSEIVYWYRPKKVKDSHTGDITYVNKFLGNAWQTSYEHFEKKFGFNREKLRRIFVKLEQMGICARELRTVKLRGQAYNNRLFIHLSLEFLNSCDSNKRKFSNCKNDNSNRNTNFFSPKAEGGYPRFRGDHIIDTKNKYNIEDRSIESNFCKNFLEEEPQAKLNRGEVQKSRVLQDFYPLTVIDCTQLQSLSGRDFSLNAMNEILNDMSKRLTDRVFYSKKGFLSYMSTALRYEMRDAVKTSNESFKIKANQSLEENRAEEIENYLTEIEYSSAVSPEWHLKKKLACVLESTKAYNFLQAYRSITIEGDIAKIHLYKPVQLSQTEQEQVLSQIKATHERFTNGEYTPIKKIELIMPKVTSKTQSFNKANLENKQLPNSLWGRVRKSLIGIYGEAIDASWFSKLEATEDTEEKAINLKASSEFIKDWIERNYEQAIEQTAQTMGIKISGLEC